MAAWHHRLSDKRRDENVSQADLGTRFGIKSNPQAAVARMEKGSWPTNARRQQAIADYLGEDLVELRREATNRVPGIEALDDLRTQVGEIANAQATIIDALTKTNDHLTKLTSAIEKLNRKRA